ncbi:hypothetical protein KL925_003462 [Ogataea polymorpha]|uniref:Uncharacterized protein n=1 Tax=Ogataea polymorpha TaxID=460523 RepID=A0A1B7SMQ5_9ASCO|nr:uncharacterized protein OGAPODRAFT_15895 [Ogataea polymorpha]KAG7892414.1 hypothetical protein KL908_003366 [Ogataea polymorpha]KAG7909190.1 hypothetical protein KL906_002684 [Ogataea polymorpha]KAG7926412.1 hypothetical protein KL925_003462 [Ogataea polymorpha]KAG7935639.1 hypothetical protein KL934_002198 [Ogataea polymorpha]KAH3677889.1 hypothetical protein OGATHE_000543 [Ogataea polymorpha]
MGAVLNVLLNIIAVAIQFPLLVLHTLGLESVLASVQSPFSKPDNVSSTVPRNSPEISPTRRVKGDCRFHDRILDAVDIVQIVHAHGYKVHEHVVQTRDGYLLSIHRIIAKNAPKNAPVVHMHHGLLTNSELFVLGDTTSRCLPFRLVELGYDVWLGNNRGNKYSRKHLTFSSRDVRFWDYSLDEFAMFDIPDTIDYILCATNQKDLTYIGFSQGSAQCLAALSLDCSLNSKIKQFIGLSPAMIPKTLSHPLLKFFVNSAPNLMYRLFGRRAILPSVVFWQKLMGPQWYQAVVDRSLVFLFNWKSHNVTESQKKVGYAHMFSPSSVKSVIHWFQIISSERFQMYDEGGASGSKLVYLSGATSKTNRVAPFPTLTITTPMLLVYGMSDSLIDIDKTVDQLSCPVQVVGIENYEHMDTLWASDVEDRVFLPVIKFLAGYELTVR